MSKIMLVNVTHVEETRVAVLQNGILDAYEIETINSAHIKGNIYNAVVENTHGTLEAAFLEVATDLKGFLPLDAVNFNLLPARGERGRSGRIGQHLHSGQKIMAQVVREPYAGKPPTVSTYFSLPGRYLVLMPGVDTLGVSRKIEDPEQRDRLKKLLKELKLPEGFGVIVRTAGMGQTKAELQRDLTYLLRLWQSIQRSSQSSEFPALVYQEADLVIRTIRDHLSSDITEMWIDSKETYERALRFVKDVMPTRAKTLRLYAGDRPLFNKYNLEEQIETIYKRKAPLPSGGEIVIDGTEALTAIDVNSARSKRKGDVEDSILQTNLEAAEEIARQCRLRDLGGLIVVDFIDMNSMRNKKKVEDAMRAAMRGDRARHDITRLSKLGLMEIARQRLKTAKMATMYNACPSCEGYGLIKNLEAAALAALRKLQTRSTRGDVGKVRIILPSEVATWMLNSKRDDLVQIERRHDLRIEVVPGENLLRHQVEFETSPREKPAEAPARPADEAVAQPAEKVADRNRTPAPAAEKPESAGAQPDDAAEPAPRKRRRRKRRTAPAEADSAETAAAPQADTPRPEPAAKPAPSQEDPKSEETPAGSEAAPSSDEPESNGRKRRRRRRRKPRQSSGGEAANGPADDPVAVPEVVPRSVRSEELMPAAVGAAQHGGRKRHAPGRGRRRSS